MNLFERTYGYEYTKFEFKCIKKVYNDKLNRSSILSGYLMQFDEWYILRPTFTTINPYIICRSELDIPECMVRVYGRWEYNIQYESLIFNIERYEVIDVDYRDIFEDVIDYEEYINILFNNSILPDNLKNFLAHAILSIEPGARITISNKNAIKLMERLLMFIPLESISINKIFIKELKRSFIIKPRLSINIEIKDNYNTNLDTIYNNYKINEFDLYKVFKFIISIYMMHIKFDQNNLDYIINNLKYRDLNTILSLSISNAKINKQKRLERHNISYVIDLVEDTLLIKS